jgi:hypothetical protein
MALKGLAKIFDTGTIDEKALYKAAFGFPWKVVLLFAKSVGNRSDQLHRMKVKISNALAAHVQKNKVKLEIGKCELESKVTLGPSNAMVMGQLMSFIIAEPKTVLEGETRIILQRYLLDGYATYHRLPPAARPSCDKKEETVVGYLYPNNTFTAINETSWKEIRSQIMSANPDILPLKSLRETLSNEAMGSLAFITKDAYWEGRDFEKSLNFLSFDDIVSLQRDVSTRIAEGDKNPKADAVKAAVQELYGKETTGKTSPKFFAIMEKFKISDLKFCLQGHSRDHQSGALNFVRSLSSAEIGHEEEAESFIRFIFRRVCGTYEYLMNPSALMHSVQTADEVRKMIAYLAEEKAYPENALHHELGSLVYRLVEIFEEKEGAEALTYLFKSVDEIPAAGSKRLAQNEIAEMALILGRRSVEQSARIDQLNSYVKTITDPYVRLNVLRLSEK